MKEEIKEILEALKPHDKEFTKEGIKEYPLVLSVKEQKILLDYITNLKEYYNDIVNKYEDLIVKYSNLQEENEILTNARYSLDRVELEKRIDKAINILELSGQNKGICTITETDTIQSVLNILKGDKDE